MESILDATIAKAFILGFMISREGYNAECFYNSPIKLKETVGYYPYEEQVECALKDEDFKRLCNEAIELVKKELGGLGVKL